MSGLFSSLRGGRETKHTEKSPKVSELLLVCFAVVSGFFLFLFISIVCLFVSPFVQQQDCKHSVFVFQLRDLFFQITGLQGVLFITYITPEVI